MRNRDAGSATLPQLGMQSNYTVVHPAHADPTKSKSIDGKIHIIWDTPAPLFATGGDEVDDIELGKGGGIARGNSTWADSAALSKQLSAEAREFFSQLQASYSDMNQFCLGADPHHDVGKTSSWRGAADHVAPHPTSPKTTFKPYRDGERAEYYSATHDRWLPAVIRVSLLRNVDVEMRYHVQLGAEQHREDIELSLLRPAFRQGEAVDIFSMRDGGAWLPGAVVGVGAMTVGYRVQVEDMQEVLEQIPPSRLRRRFAPTESVLIFLGAARGWLAAEVATADMTASYSVEPPHEAQMPWTWVLVNENCPQRENGRVIFSMDDDVAEQLRWVPSYLVFRRKFREVSVFV